jgi:hypothetical protein
MLIGALSVIILSVLPGAYFAFGLAPRTLPVGVRVGLSILLSPLVIAPLWFGLYRVMDIRLAALLIVAGSLPALAILVSRIDRCAIFRPRNLILALLLIVPPLVYVVLHWLTLPGFRLYAWHNLMQADVCGLLTRQHFRLEEPELAGVPLVYNWVGHLPLTVAGIAGQTAVTAAYPVFNCVLLATLLLNLYEAAIILGAAPPGAVLGAGFAVFCSNLPRECFWLLNPSYDWLRVGLLDARLTNILTKYCSMDMMPYSYLALTMPFSLVPLFYRSRSSYLVGFTVMLFVSTAMLYTLALPALGLVVLLLTVALELAAPKRDTWAVSPAGRAMLMALFLGTALACAILVLTVPGDSGPAFRVRSLRAIVWEFIHVGLVLAIPGLLALVPLLGSWRAKWKVFVPLLVAAGICCVAYAMLSRGLAYKYVHYARLILALLSGLACGPLLQRTGVTGWACAVILPLGLGCLAFWHNVSTYVVGVRNVPGLLALRESPRLLLPADHPDREWVAAIRDQTSDDTIIVCALRPYHVSAFLGRSLFFPASMPYVAGYGMDPEDNLTGFRGHSETLYESREHTVHAVLSGGDAYEFAAAETALLELHRPIAVVVRHDSAFSQWVCQRSGWRPLLKTNDWDVWLAQNS